jgi:hypothetical protein
MIHLINKYNPKANGRRIPSSEKQHQLFAASYLLEFAHAMLANHTAPLNRLNVEIDEEQLSIVLSSYESAEWLADYIESLSAKDIFHLLRPIVAMWRHCDLDEYTSAWHTL